MQWAVGKSGGSQQDQGKGDEFGLLGSLEVDETAGDSRSVPKNISEAVKCGEGGCGKRRRFGGS